MPIIVRDLIVGIALVQEPDKRRKSPARPVARWAEGSGNNPWRRKAAHGRAAPGCHSSNRRPLGQAVALLELIVHLVEARALAELRKADLAQVRQELREHEREEGRLRRELTRSRALPCSNPAQSEPETRNEQVVHRMLEFVHEHYAQPITLQHCADELGRAPAYLSTLFSRTVGLPFKTYVTELRLEKARKYLSDPARRVSEVAHAVGYTDANRFRQAFKYATGLAPRPWRESLRIPARI